MHAFQFSDREFKFAEADGRMTVAGYGSVFNVVDHGGDLILPGAFAESLAARKGRGPLPMYLEHGRFGGGPASPIGKWDDLAEDGAGLKAAGEIIDTPDGLAAHKLLKAGLLGGLSIGYRVKSFDQRTKPEEPRRTIKAAELVEISVVQMPMNEAARVLSVKSLMDGATVRDVEEILRSVDFPAAQAKAMASFWRETFDAKRDAGEGAEELAALARRNINLLKRTA